MERPKGQPVRDEPPRDLRACVFEHDGEQLVVLSHAIADEAATPIAPMLGRALTRAQSEVLALVLAGRTNREIARARRTAVGTVAKQLEQIYRRLGINSRRELAALAGRSRSGQRTPE